MNLSQSIGDSKTHAIPLTWDGAAFSPGEDWILIFTAKRALTDPDSQAVFQKTSGAGITVSGSTASVATVPEDTNGEAIASLYYDIRAQEIATGARRTVVNGRLQLFPVVGTETSTSTTVHTTEEPLPIGGAVWGEITGTLSDQTDLQAALDAIVSAGVADGNKGSITVTGSGGTWTINTGAVTNDMLAGSIAISKITGLQTALDAKAASADLTSHTGNTSNPHSVTKAQVGLSAVENTALSTWTGSSNITTLGTIGTGTWQGSIIAPAYLGTGSSISTKFLRGDGTWQEVAAGTTTPTDLNGGTELVINAVYFDTFTANRTLTFAAGTPANGDSIELTFDATGEVVLTIPTSYRIGDTGTTTAITFPAGNHIIRWTRRDGKWFVADSAWQEGADVTAPTISSVTISADGLTLTIVFSESVTVATGAGFTVDASVSGAGIGATYDSGSGNTHVWTLASEILSGETVTLDYATVANDIEDAAGNDLGNVSAEAVTNNSTQVPPTLSSATIAANGTTLTLVFSEAVSAGAGGSGGFDVDGTVTNNAATYASGTGTNTIVFSLSSTVLQGETCNLDYVQPGNGWQNSAGHDVASITNAAVTNNSTQTSDVTAPTLSSATIAANGTTLTLVFSETVVVGAGGNGGFNVDASTGGSDITCTYASGSGSNTLVYTLGTTVLSGETCDLDYTQPGNGIEDSAGNDFASITSAAVTNNSTQSGVSTSYGNSGGTGYRQSSITTSASAGLMGGDGNTFRLVNGNMSESNTYFVNTSLSGSVYLRFDFGSGASKVIDEAKWYQQNSTSHGTWKWQGSNNGTDWADIGSSFTLGGATTQTITALSGNTTGYRYYQIVGVSGSASNNPYLYEIEFKIDDA